MHVCDDSARLGKTTMTNNDILRRLRYTFELSDADMAAVFALADLKVRRGHIIA